MRIERRFTRRGQGPYEGLTFVKRSSEIRNPDGSTVFKLENIDVPEQWSQLAIDILAQKYFRKAGVPQKDLAGNPLVGSDGKPVLGSERDARHCGALNIEASGEFGCEVLRVGGASSVATKKCGASIFE